MSKTNGNGKIRPGQKTPFHKCTEMVRNERIERLANYLANRPLATYGELKKYCKTHFKLSYWMAGKYITRARAFLADRAQMPKREMANLCINTLFDIANNGTERGKIAAVNQLVAIAGLEAPRRIEQSGPRGGPIVTRDDTPIPKLSRERFLEIVGERVGGNGKHED